ncbi:MAG: DNA processing protein [Cellvibrionaceae bacterium]|jgi:DNA processing protein
MSDLLKTEDSHLKYWLGFNLVDGLGPSKVQALLERFGNAEAAWHAPELDLARMGFDSRSLKNFLGSRQVINLEEELAKVMNKGISLLPFGSDDYPRYLKEIPAPPVVLYVWGTLLPADHQALAIVGTRRLTSYGRQMTRELAQGLSRSGITVVSGLARGIDTEAHYATLDAGGRTIAILGSGLDYIYPPENRDLVDRILSSGQGAVISEYPLSTKPQGKNFPARNRIISGLSLGTIVVEGALKSGAMITARYAVEQNREVFAVPGFVNSPASAGPNRLIQEGAKLITCVEDVLEEIQVEQVIHQQAIQMALPESAEEAALFPVLNSEPQHIDDLAKLSELPASQVSSTLTLLELKGIVQHVGGMKYVLAR